MENLSKKICNQLLSTLYSQLGRKLQNQLINKLDIHNIDIIKHLHINYQFSMDV